MLELYVALFDFAFACCLLTCISTLPVESQVDNSPQPCAITSKMSCIHRSAVARRPDIRSSKYRVIPNAALQNSYEKTGLAILLASHNYSRSRTGLSPVAGLFSGSIGQRAIASGDGDCTVISCVCHRRHCYHTRLHCCQHTSLVCGVSIRGVSRYQSLKALSSQINSTSNNTRLLLDTASQDLCNDN